MSVLPIAARRTVLAFAAVAVAVPLLAAGSTAQAVDRYRAAGNRRGTAQALNAVGWYHGQLGEYDRTLACCRDALALLEQFGDRHGQAESWGQALEILDQLGHADADDVRAKLAGSAVMPDERLRA
jgi:hypothetical protein